MSMASDINDDPDTLVASELPDVQHLVHHQICHELFMARAGVTPAQACGVGCRTCGVIDASPARCEQCTGVHTAGRPFTGAAPGMLQDDDRGLSKWLANTPEAMRCAREAAGMIRACRCGPDGCADSSCPGRTTVQHLPAEDTEGGAL